MNTDKRIQEYISALVDGEQSSDELALAIAELSSPHHQNDWEVYHQIGDVLRSDDLAISMSSDFSRKMAARLAAEPVYSLPAVAQPEVRSEVLPPVLSAAGNSRDPVMLRSLPGPVTRFCLRKRYHLAGALAAVFAIVMVLVPQLAGSPHPVAVIASARPVPAQVAAVSLLPTVKEQHQPFFEPVHSGVPGGILSATDEEMMLRDPRIDSYLASRSRYPSSVYSDTRYTSNVVSPPPGKK